MSYSFTITALSKPDAKSAVQDQLDTVVTEQPVHAVDREAAGDACDNVIDLLDDPAQGQSVSVSVWGSVGQYEGKTRSVGLNINASVQ